jgi:HAD superfamily hydrolase (TIGR01549 family)
MNINTVFFDLGNTLLYNNHLNYDSIRTACQVLAENFVSFGYEINAKNLADKHFQNLTDYYDLRELDYIEHSADIIFSHTLEEMGFSCLPEEHILTALKAFYLCTETNWHLTENAVETLATLKEQNKKIGLITNASYAEDIRQLLRKHRIEAFFDSVVISAEVGYRKPRQEIFDIALYSLGSRPDESVMIGDSFMADIFGACQKGIRSIWFKRYSITSQLNIPVCNPDAETMDLSEIPRILADFDKNILTSDNSGNNGSRADLC